MAVTWPRSSNECQTLTFRECLRPALRFNAIRVCIFVISLSLSSAPSALPPPLLGPSIFTQCCFFHVPAVIPHYRGLTHPLDKYRCVTIWCHRSCQVKWSRLTVKILLASFGSFSYQPLIKQFSKTLHTFTRVYRQQFDTDESSKVTI